MTEERITPLRARMIEDMRIRGMGEKAQKSHIRAIKDFAQFLGHSPDTATPEELRAYQLHMTDTGVTASTFNVRIVALRFFFGMTCGRPNWKRRNQRSLPRSPCASRAHAAVARCASPKSFVAARNRRRAPRHGSRPHDETPVTVTNTTPDLAIIPDRLSFAPRGAAPTNRRRNAPSETEHHQLGGSGRHWERSAAFEPPTTLRRRWIPQPTFPIDSDRPPRLPPWEDFQRGPTKHRQETLHHGPHRKSFAKAASRSLTRAAVQHPHTGRSCSAQRDRAGKVCYAGRSGLWF